jgi:hypothetical protein
MKTKRTKEREKFERTMIALFQVKKTELAEKIKEETHRRQGLARQIRDFINTKGLAMVQIRCLRGFETKSEAFA